MVFNDKKVLRKEIKKILLDYKDSFTNVSETITKQIIESKEYKDSDTILSYMSLPDEVNVNIESLSENKNVFIPKVREKSLTLDFFRYDKNAIKAGAYNILEPDETSELFNMENIKDYGNILILIPGRAFTKDGKRLGRGKGFYDRFLMQIKKEALGGLTVVGVCYPIQIIKDLPTEKHDILMDKIFYGI